VEFACDKAREGLRFESLPAVLEQFAGAFGGRAALAVRPRPGESPAVIAVYPPGAADPALLAQIGALIGDHPEVTVAGGCLRGSLALGHAGSAPGQRPAARDGGQGAESALVAVTQPAPGRLLSALVLVGDSALWTAETQATARTLVAVIAAQYRRASDTVELAEREEITRALVEASPDAVVIADATRRIVGFNAEAGELLRRPRAEALGQDVLTMILPGGDRARFIAAMEMFLRTGERGEFVGRMRLAVLRGDGSELTVEMTPLPLEVGGTASFCCFLRDLSELERANAALAASQARFQLLSELAPVGIARTDRGGVCGYVNERWCVLGGGPAGDFTGSPWTRVLHPDDAGKVAQEWAQARAAGAELRTECRLRPNGGPQLWAQAAVAALPAGDDQPAGFLVALTNLSARKRAEQESGRLLEAERAACNSLADQTARLRRLMAVAVTGVLFVDENDVIVQLNQNYADVLGVKDSLDELIGTPAGRLRGHIERSLADPAGFLALMAKTRLARQPVAGAAFACSDGRTVESDYLPVFADSQYRGALWLLRPTLASEDHVL
jgi:PAS domain S-box-containing protein